MNLRVRIVHDVLAISTRVRRGAERRIVRRARPRGRGFTFSNMDLDRQADDPIEGRGRPR